MAEHRIIHELGPQGDGVHRTASGVMYVERGLPGETVEVALQANGRGEIVQIVAPSPHRAVPPCMHYDACGGCALQHANEAFYRTWKVDIVRDALAKKALTPLQWRDPVFVAPGTRRRATFSAAKRGKTLTIGYFRRRSHEVTEISHCLVVEPAIMTVRAKLAEALAPLVQNTADVFVQTLDGRVEIVITGPIGPRDLRAHEAFAAMTRDCGIDRIAWRLHERAEPETILEANALRARFGVLDVALPPLAFLQPTKAGEAALANAVMTAVPPKGTYADLFSGCGTFTGPMLARGHVDAFESDATAIAALNKAKAARPLKAVQRDLFRKPLSGAELERYDAVVFDPPRAGAHEQAKALAQSNVPVVVAVSCNPGTFARDARALVDGGYAFASIHVVDQFIWSHHVELVATFVKAS